METRENDFFLFLCLTFKFVFFNFNNFALIYLLTSGGPFEGNQTQVGSTDLLITYAFRLAIGGVTPNYGFAAAISMFIFVIIAIISLQGFRQTARLEDVN